LNPPITKKLITVTVVCGWLVAVGWGMWRLADYSLAPGAQGAAPIDWPADTALTRDSAKFTAVVALHPECPCSKATVEELDSIVAQTAGRLRVHALFVDLPGLPGPVEKSDLWQRASRIRGIDVRRDPAGAETRRFGARTSGETRLYSADGHLRFSGGITAARGHVGDNPGQAAIVSLIAHQTSAATPIRTPVFGCALWDEPAGKP
jgi:hypothetical protein